MRQSPGLSVEPRRLPVTLMDLPSIGRPSIRQPVAPSTPIVFIADDDPSLRAALVAVAHGMGWRTRELTSARALLSAPMDVVPSCIVLDLSLPRHGGHQLQELAAERPETSVVCITGMADITMTVRAMRAGAVDVLPKPVRADLLLDSIRLALERSDALLRQTLETRRLRDCYATLSLRERQVMALVASGLLNKQVGGELGISEITVKAHRGRVMRKMSAPSLAALVKIAGKLKIATPGDAH